MTLQNTKSGKTGEHNVLGKLSRFGLKVSKPQWGDDEVDYEIRWGDGDESVNIPLQVKSVQFSHKRDKSFIQGLKKNYLKRNALLCLAIYNPDHDWMWLFCGSDIIVAVYERQSEWNRKHRSYSYLDGNDDIRVAVPHDGQAFHSEYRVHIEDQSRVLTSIEEVASRKKVRILSSSHDREPSVAMLCAVRFLFKDDETLNIGGQPLSYQAEGTVADLLTLVYDTAKQHFERRFPEDRDRILLMRVLRELIVNAFAHRSYRSWAPIEITLSEDSIEVANPGGLPEELSMAQFHAECIVVVRNPTLVGNLVQLSVMENMGVGITNVEHLIKEHGLSQIRFSQSEGRFIAAVKVTKANKTF